MSVSQRQCSVDDRQELTTLDAVPMSIWCLDRAHRVQFANRAAAASVGRPATELTGQAMAAILGNPAFERTRPYREAALRGERSTWQGRSLATRDADRYLEHVFDPRTDASGAVAGYHEFVRDITAAKAAERRTRQSAMLLTDALESLPEGVALFDAEDRLIVCNERLRELFGSHRDLLACDTMLGEMLHAGVARGLFTDATEDAEAWIAERTRLRDDLADDAFLLAGGRRVVLASRRLRGGALMQVWDRVPDPAVADRSSEASEEPLRKILEACPVPITLNRLEDGVVIYESPAARTLMRWCDATGQNSVIPRWVNARDRDDYLRQLRRHGAVDGLEVRFRKGDGEEFWGALSSRLITYCGQDVIVSNIVDMTERYAAEVELARQREYVHQSEKLSALGQLLTGVAHELNNPLSVLVGQTEMLRETTSDQRSVERIEMIGRAADRCARIVRTFLAMARHEPTEMAAVDVNEVIESALEVTAYLLRTSGVDVSLQLARSIPGITGNADQLRQVFTNLIVNAQHALQERERNRRLRITSAYQSRQDRIVVKVKDSGPGIPDNIRSRIFDPLFTTKPVGGGTGMGLTLCHRIVEAHCGTIRLERASSQGTVFKLSFPRVSSHGESWQDISPAAGKVTGLRVLILDDEEDVSETLADILTTDGHTVEVSCSGFAALERVKQRSFDVILCDIRMPELDGPGFYRALADARPAMLRALAFMTGDTLTPKVKAFLESTERPYMEKPIAPAALRELVDLITRFKRP